MHRLPLTLTIFFVTWTIAFPAWAPPIKASIEPEQAAQGASNPEDCREVIAIALQNRGVTYEPITFSIIEDLLYSSAPNTLSRDLVADSLASARADLFYLPRLSDSAIAAVESSRNNVLCQER